MALKKGDLLDEYKRFPDSCGLLIKVMAGGEGFHKLVCCGHELTEEDVVPEPIKKAGRKRSHKGLGLILDEKQSHPSSCGLRMMIVDGGQGFQHMECCGHSLTLADEKEFMDLGIRNVRMGTGGNDGPTGNA